MKRIALAALALALSACGGSADQKADTSTAGGGAAAGGKAVRIAVIPKGTTHEFWKSIHAGALQAAQELSAQGDTVSIIWKGPIREDDREQQVQVVEGFLSQGVQGIVLAPLDRRALVRPVEEALRAGIPTVVIDSRLDSDSIVGYVATDNYKGGQLAAERLGTLVGGTGRVLMLRYQEGSASTMERERGFLDGMKAKHPGVTVVSSDQYAGATRETAKRASENLLNRHGNELQGIFTPNESSTIGMLLALQDIGKAGQIRLVGFDAGQTLITALRAKQIEGLIVQNGLRMGYLGVRTIVDHLRGRPVEKLVDTGVTLVTPENVDAPEIRDLLNPPIGKYLPGGVTRADAHVPDAHVTEPLLRVEGVAKRYGATLALDGVDLAVRAGEVHALIGENGAGKSTLMNVLAGAVRPDRGALSLAGRPYAPSSPHAARRSGVALIHQELSLCPHLTVTENIVLGAEVARGGWLDRRACRARAAELLGEFDRPDIDPDRRLGDLPLAARQVVEICRALTADARVLLMDEPTSSFQRADTERLFALVRRLSARGIAVVYISHFLEEVREIADGYTVLRDGRSVDTGRIAEATNEQLITRMVGRSMAGLFPPRDARRPGEVLLSVRELAAPPAVRHASFDVRAGEILGIAGLIGAGRTELVRALFGLDAATAGTVTLRGRTTPARAPAARRLAEGLGYLSEDRKGEGLALPLSIADNLCATRPPRRWAIGGLDVARQHALARRWMDALRVRARSPGQAVRALSGGNQQKVALGRLLHQEADVLLLDEPTRGIDVGSKVHVYEAIARAAGEGKAVLVVSSYLPELFGLCDRLAVMRRGRLSAARPIEAWTPETVLAEAIGERTDDQRPTTADDV